MNVQERAKNILVHPDREWAVIAEEPAEAWTLLRDFAVPLSAIPAVCQAVAGAYSIGFLRSAIDSVQWWAIGLIGLWLTAVIIARLAPEFWSYGNSAEALKVVVYASTPGWIAGVLNLFPPLRILMVIGLLYSIYLFWIGLPVVMQTPRDAARSYVIVSAVVMFAVAAAVGGFLGVIDVFWRFATAG